MLLLFWHFFGINFCAQAADLVTVGSLACTRNARSCHFHQKNTYRKLYLFFLRLRIVRVLRCSLMSLSSLCGRLRDFSFFQPLIFGTFLSRFRSFGGSAPLVCAPAADFVAIDFATLRRFTYFLESRATVTQLSGLVGPGPGSGTAAKSIKNMQVFKHFSKQVINTCRISYFFRDRGSKSSPLGPSRSTFMRRLRTW